jgi:hypothetical protein
MKFPTMRITNSLICPRLHVDKFCTSFHYRNGMGLLYVSILVKVIWEFSFNNEKYTRYEINLFHYQITIYFFAQVN